MHSVLCAQHLPMKRVGIPYGTTGCGEGKEENKTHKIMRSNRERRGGTELFGVSNGVSVCALCDGCTPTRWENVIANVQTRLPRRPFSMRTEVVCLVLPFFFAAERLVAFCPILAFISPACSLMLLQQSLNLFYINSWCYIGDVSTESVCCPSPCRAVR